MIGEGRIGEAVAQDDVAPRQRRFDDLHEMVATGCKHDERLGQRVHRIVQRESSQLFGKRRSTRLRKGATWLKTTLVQCAWAASRKKASYLQAQFQRLRHRRGPKKAICAVAASILTAVYHMLRDGTFYQDLGAEHFRRTSPETQANRLARQIARLGFTCTLARATEGSVSV